LSGLQNVNPFTMDTGVSDYLKSGYTFRTGTEYAAVGMRI
jgi:hypothetical protein